MQPTMFQIISELVNHFGGEQLGKILISDVSNKIKKVMKWTGSIPLYLYQEVAQDGTIYNSFSTNYEELKEKQDTGHGTIKEFHYGEDVGYILTDFVYPGELIGNAGDSVVTILDQIRDVLGNYEYFYDIDGNFRFQEIKNYLNTSYSTFLINELNASDYLVDYTDGKSLYIFDEADIIQSYSKTPQY
jgi:regulator of PEP synthase PpsR (kinase-PPPase family)